MADLGEHFKVDYSNNVVLEAKYDEIVKDTVAVTRDIY